jgi:hypothetical protein
MRVRCLLGFHEWVERDQQTVLEPKHRQLDPVRRRRQHCPKEDYDMLWPDGAVM